MSGMEIKGIEGLVKFLNKFPGETRKAAKQGMTKAVVRIQGRAREQGYVPVDTGRLKQSIAYKVKPLGQRGVQGIVGSAVHYAAYQEFGTKRGVKPKRYLGRAISEQMQQLADDLFGAIQAAVERLAKRHGAN